MNKASLAVYRAKWQRFNAQVQARWQPLALREKRMVAGMAVFELVERMKPRAAAH